MIGIVPREIDDYAFDHTTPLPPVMEELRKATYDSVPDAEMLSDRLIGTLLQALIRVSGPSVSWKLAPSQDSAP